MCRRRAVYARSFRGYVAAMLPKLPPMPRGSEYRPSRTLGGNFGNVFWLPGKLEIVPSERQCGIRKDFLRRNRKNLKKIAEEGERKEIGFGKKDEECTRSNRSRSAGPISRGGLWLRPDNSDDAGFVVDLCFELAVRGCHGACNKSGFGRFAKFDACREIPVSRLDWTWNSVLGE